MKSGLKFKNVYLKDVLIDIKFDLKPGTINALIGRNGSGKTFLLKSIVGLTDYSGEISLDDIIFDKKNIEGQIKNIGIFLNVKTLENKKVILNLMDPLLNLNYEEIESKKKVYSLAKKLGIDDLLYQEVNTLSHSQKKVIAFAQSIIHNPNLIVIDNLFESLDKNHKEKIISYLKNKTTNKNNIVLFTTNNSEDLLIANNLLIIKSNKTIVEGETQKLLENDSLFLKNGIELPFISDLSNKMIAYELIDKSIYDINEMVDEIWR